MRNLGFDALLDKEIEEHFGEKPKKLFKGTVIVSYAVEMEVEAETEEQAREMMQSDAMEMPVEPGTEIWDFKEIG
jgi:type IV secretory pathway TraG/TraD family ATPase VirD4